jgi:fructose-bisphosphate aldolase class II
MHQDHGTSPAICQGALDLGFGSVMMDGSLRKTARPRPTSTTTST